jgi:hypothetical protein
MLSTGRPRMSLVIGQRRTRNLVNLEHAQSFGQ